MNLTYRWAIKLAVKGDARFASHHDMLRAIERIATRAKLPLHYTQGFNPHVVMSLSCPRPVGVASMHDLLCIALDGEIDPKQMVDNFNEHSIPGLEFVDATLLPTKKPPQPELIKYKLDLRDDELQEVSQKVSQLNAQDSWDVQRKKKSKRRGKPETLVTINIKPRVAELTLRDKSLQFSLVGSESGWAKPSEIMSLTGMAGPQNVARLTRTKIELDIDNVNKKVHNNIDSK